MDQPGHEETVIQTDPRKTRPAGILGSRGVLVALSGASFGRTAVVAGGWTVVGRQEDCDFALADPMMSRRHFRVGVEGDGFAVEDLGSTNGTTLNTKKLDKKTQLLYGDRVVAGGTIFRFFVEEEVEKK
jgi:pSer/pThr/pTyr-binding forkhead associated (FHA) protein